MDAVAVGGLATTWGVVVSALLNIINARKPMETWQKAAWAFGLCFAPFLIVGGVLLWWQGLDSILTLTQQSVAAGWQCYGGAFAGYTGQKVGETIKSKRAIRKAKSDPAPTDNTGGK